MSIQANGSHWFAITWFDVYSLYYYVSAMLHLTAPEAYRRILRHPCRPPESVVSHIAHFHSRCLIKLISDHILATINNIYRSYASLLYWNIYCEGSKIGRWLRHFQPFGRLYWWSWYFLQNQSLPIIDINICIHQNIIQLIVYVYIYIQLMHVYLPCLDPDPILSSTNCAIIYVYCFHLVLLPTLS